MTETLTLYGFGVNDRSGKIRWLCHELDIPVEERRLALGEHRKAPYTDLNPYGMVPTAQWRGQTLIESTATSTYIAEQHPASRLVVAPNELERAEYLQWVALFAETLESRLVERLLGGVGMIPDAFVQTTDSMLKRRLPILVERLPKAGFLVADRFTLADIEASYSLRLAIRAELLSFDDVSDYLRPLMDRPAAQASQFFSSLGA
jgi:glutathione S-transferase